jgi:hypothetical protein
MTTPREQALETLGWMLLENATIPDPLKERLKMLLEAKAPQTPSTESPFERDQMFGCTPAEWKKYVDEYEAGPFSFPGIGVGMLAMSILSDCQELLARFAHDADAELASEPPNQIRQYINRAKYVIAERMLPRKEWVEAARESVVGPNDSSVKLHAALERDAQLHPEKD